MRGIAFVIDVDGTIKEIELNTTPTLEQLQEWVGGYIEAIPFWEKYLGKRCVAFCNEEGKLMGLPINHAATVFWHHHTNYKEDVLSGPIAIITGDDTLLNNL